MATQQHGKCCVQMLKVFCFGRALQIARMRIAAGVARHNHYWKELCSACQVRTQFLFSIIKKSITIFISHHILMGPIESNAQRHRAILKTDCHLGVRR